MNFADFFESLKVEGSDPINEEKAVKGKCSFLKKIIFLLNNFLKKVPEEITRNYALPSERHPIILNNSQIIQIFSVNEQGDLEEKLLR